MITNNEEYQAAIKKMNELLALEVVKELDALALAIETYEEMICVENPKIYTYHDGRV